MGKSMRRVVPVRTGRKSLLGWALVLLAAVVLSFASPGNGQAHADSAPGTSVGSTNGGVTLGLAGGGKPASRVANSDLPDDVRVWFATKTGSLGQSLREYLPSSTKVPPEAQIEVGTPTQVVTWSARLLRGTYTPDSVVAAIDMWVAPVSIDSRELGVVVYKPDSNNLYPLPLPTQSASLAPKVTVGVPEPTLSPREENSPASGGYVTEPKNSHLPIRVDNPGASYVLPELAHALLATSPDAAHSNRPVYDPVIHGWFTLNEERLVPVSHAARARLGGAVTLGQVQEAVQSWWGTLSSSPTPTPEALQANSNSTLVWVVALAVAIAGVALLVVWLTFRWQSRPEDVTEVLPLPDPELILVPVSPPTSAVPTIAVSGLEAEGH